MTYRGERREGTTFLEVHIYVRTRTWNILTHAIKVLLPFQLLILEIPFCRHYWHLYLNIFLKHWSKVNLTSVLRQVVSQWVPVWSLAEPTFPYGKSGPRCWWTVSNTTYLLRRGVDWHSSTASHTSEGHSTKKQNCSETTWTFGLAFCSAVRYTTTE